MTGDQRIVRTIVAGCAVLWLSGSACKPRATSEPTFECAACHPTQVDALARSHHARGQALVTRLPTGTTGPFEILDGGKTLAWAEPDGGRAEGELVYTLGVEPIVQVAVRLANGRVQVPPIGLVDGGWRPIPYAVSGPIADWKGPLFNWNGSCAPCHATGFVTGGEQLRSSWKSLAVSCEACHGDSQGHVTWLRGERAPGHAAGFSKTLGVRARFEFPPDGGAIARPFEALADTQSDVCAACHSRRRPLKEVSTADEPFLERFEPELSSAPPRPGEEVYEVPSFSRSVMHRAGVRCTDCHEPHAATLRAEGNGVCERCHRAGVFDVELHRGREVRCVTCHLPPSTFLGVDVRHDHFVRRAPEVHEGDALSPWARAAFGAELTLDTPDGGTRWRSAAASADAWDRLGAASSLGAWPRELRNTLGATLLVDPVRAVRVRAARALAKRVPDATRADLESAERANAFRGDAWLNLSNAARGRGDLALAEQHLRHGLELDPHFVPLTINLADVLRELQRDSEAVAILTPAAAADGPWRAAANHALGLTRWRLGDREGALTAFGLAALDGDERHLEAWVLAEREVHGNEAARRALTTAFSRAPGSAVLRRLDALTKL